MDTEAQHLERDRSSPHVPEDSPRPRSGEARSRFAVPGDARRDQDAAPEEGEDGALAAADGDADAGDAGDASGVESEGDGGSESAGEGDGGVESEGEGGGGRLRDWLPGGSLTLTAGSCLVFLLLMTLFVAQPFTIPSTSMEPGLRTGDRVLVNKLAYRLGDGPARGDVVVFQDAEGFGDGHFVKRVVGVGGDRVVCCDRDGRLRINGRAVDESAFLGGDAASAVRFDVVVPDGRLFVLGDHRAASSDSRDHLGSPGGGMVSVEDVTGRADWIVWPAGRWTGIEPSGAYTGVPAPDGAHG
ncbi:signal peptidase I [Streptomyces sp. NPDC005012]|uniref:signal peptidase I n=1 Tax=Streptomyces sp. NPDC005012 TaxID=3154558 RepID=UPI0033A160F1